MYPDPRLSCEMVDQVVKYFGAIHVLHNNGRFKVGRPECVFCQHGRVFTGLNGGRSCPSMSTACPGCASGRRQMQKAGNGGSIIQTAHLRALSIGQRIYEGSFYLVARSVTRRCIRLPRPPVVGLTRYSRRIGVMRGIRLTPWLPAGWERAKRHFQVALFSPRPLGRMAQPE